MNLLIKIILTFAITAFALYPYMGGGSQTGIFDELYRFGLIPAILLAVVFFTGVGFYCRALQKTLALIKPGNRKAKPSSIWLMFLIPYNFFEDFFIIANVSRSLEQESLTNERLAKIRDFGWVTGMGWATAQILSLYPNIIGQVAGCIGILLWIRHWIFISRINKLLETKSL